MTETPNASGVPASAADTLLEGSGLHTFYGVSHILHGVNFSVRKGAVSYTHLTLPTNREV